MFTKFHGCIANYMEATLTMCFVDWARVPQSKNSTRGISELGDNFYLFQYIKLCRFTKFHGCIANNKEFTTVTSSEDWAQVR